MLKDKEKKGKQQKDNAFLEGSIGPYLKEAREKANITFEEIYEKTRLRVPLIEALEEEDWERLPSRTFVRGFVKSYALAVGLDPEEALSRFDASAPTSEKHLKPLLESTSRRSFIPLVLALLLILAIAFLLFWARGGAKEEEAAGTKTSLPKASPVKELQQEPPLPLGGGASQKDGAEPSVVPLKNDTITLTTPSVPVELPEPPKAPLLLKGFVKERTWLRVQVDGGEPKEYIFSPGAQPQWQGKEVFDIIIGNAAGIQFELNGEKIQDLGRRGEVVHLRLPANKETHTLEE